MLIYLIILLILIMFLLLNKTCDKKENFGCSAGQTCCLQGWYGAPPKCVKCPHDKPSSPRTDNGGPDEDCNCLNAAASSCFVCQSPICAPFKPDTGVCTQVCPNCSVQRVNGVLKPKCN